MFMEKIGKKTQRRSDAFLPKSLQVSKIFPIFAPKIEDNMEQQTDIRWIQRYANFHKACTRLLDVTEADRFMDDLSELEIEGLVQRFEYTFELEV